MTPESLRAAARLQFATARLGAAPARLEPASADASFRSYWRVTTADGDTRILMDAPPGKEDLTPWLDIASRLRAAGLHAPKVFAADGGQGFVLMEDLGDATYLPRLDATSVDRLYGEALEALLRMQTRVDTEGFPDYDRERLVAELELMPQWFLGRHLGFTPSCEEWDVIEAASTRLIAAALEQPRVFVHRDYHSRNLLVCEARDDARALASPGIIDFQDAVLGPVTYDLVSLLRDCYITWPPERVAAWAEDYRQRLLEAGVLDAAVDSARFRRWFDLMGLQRHLKVLGIFARLWYRDGKRQYLGDLPRVWDYTLAVARVWPEFAQLAALLERARGGRDLTEPRTEPAR